MKLQVVLFLEVNYILRHSKAEFRQLMLKTIQTLNKSDKT